MLSSQINKYRKQLLDFGDLQLNLRGIRVLNKIPSNVIFISQLYLDGNHLVSLSGIQQFLNLEVFHFDYNYISLPNELNKISNPFFVKELSFIGNIIQKDRNLTLEKLRENGFSRLALLNPPHLLSNKGHFVKEKQSFSDQLSYSKNQLTQRREPQYLNEEKTQRKRLIGKICHNNKLRTVKNNKAREQTMSRDTRESTVRPQSISHFNHIHREKITPFEFQQSYHEREDEEEEERPEMESQSATARFQDGQNIPTISQQFLSDQKQLLAVYFYRRTLLQKAFDGFKVYKQRFLDLEGQEGQIVNDYLETLHYSLIKLKHEAMRKNNK